MIHQPIIFASTTFVKSDMDIALFLSVQESQVLHIPFNNGCLQSPVLLAFPIGYANLEIPQICLYAELRCKHFCIDKSARWKWHRLNTKDLCLGRAIPLNIIGSCIGYLDCSSQVMSSRIPAGVWWSHFNLDSLRAHHRNLLVLT